MTKNNAETMRKYLTLLTESAESQELDEAGLSKLSRAGRWLTQWASGKQKGLYQVQRAGVPFKNLFRRTMAIKKVDYDTVTWKQLVAFLMSNAARSIPLGDRRGIPLTAEDIKNMLNDGSLRNSINSEVPGYKLPTGQNIKSFFDQAISGRKLEVHEAEGDAVPPSPMTAGEPLAKQSSDAEDIGGEQAQKVIDILLQDAIAIMFDKLEGVETFDDKFAEPEAKPVAATAVAPTAETPPPSFASIKTAIETSRNLPLGPDQVEALRNMLTMPSNKTK